MQSADISIIITTYNRQQMLKSLLEALRQQKGARIEIIVCDDGSSPPAIFEHLVDRYIWRKDDGFHKTELLNQAVLAAGSQHVLFIDDDCLPYENNWAATHLETLARNEVSIGRLDFFRIDESGAIEKLDHVTGIPGTYFTSVNVGFRRDVLERIGMFDPSFDGYYGHEDTDLGLRIQHNVLRVEYTGTDGTAGHFGKFYGLNEDGTRIQGISARNFEYLQAKWGRIFG